MFQDPMEGVLLLAYTPRQPSIGTENMLRCAYRAGLRGEALLKDERGGWKMCGGRDKTIRDVPGVYSRPGEVYGGGHDNPEKVRNLAHDEDEPQAVDQSSNIIRNATYHCRIPSHAGATTKPLPRKAVTTTNTSKGCRPVLLSFFLSPGVTQRSTTDSTAGNNSEIFGGSAALPRALVSLSEESVWVSEWESVFPDLRCRKREVRDVALEPVNALACRPGEGSTDDDAVTDEFLWGRPSVEYGAGKEV